MVLYIRRRTRWVTFVNSVQELRDFCAAYIPGTPVVLGDLAQFNNEMREVLLKFLEDHTSVDCYSTEDIPAGPLLSRFTFAEKEQEPLLKSISDDTFLQSPRRVQDAEQHLAFPAGGKLLAAGCSGFEFTLLKAKYGAGS